MANFYGSDANDNSFAVNPQIQEGYGGAGSDTVGSSLVGLVYMDGGTGNDTVVADWDTYGTLSGGDGNDKIVGGTSLLGQDYLYGGAGDDIVYASDPDKMIGPDFISGDGGRDALYGYFGDDSIYGGDGDESGAPITAGYFATPSTATPGLYGGAGDDLLDGGFGNDVLDGGSGNDILAGGFGNDTFLVDSIADRVFESPGAGADTVTASVSYVLPVAAEIEVLAANPLVGATINLTGSQFANTVLGHSGANTLKGLDGNDTLKGEAGKDKLYGGAGKDTLAGGAGPDTFVFDTAPHKTANVDRITDFSSKDDAIHLDNKYFSKIGKNGKLAKDAFVAAKKALDAEDRVIYDKGTGSLFYDADGTGTGAAIKIAVLQNKAKLGLADFLVV